MNIAFVHTVFPGGGAERVTRDIARGICTEAPGEYSFFVYTPNVKEELLSEDYSRWFKGISKYDFASESSDLERLIFRDKIDVLVMIARRVQGLTKIRKETSCKIIFANHGEPFHQRYEIIQRKKAKCRSEFKWKLLSLLYEDLGFAEYKAKRQCAKDYRLCDVYTVLCDEYKTKICTELGLNADSSHIAVINNSEEQVEDVCFSKEKIVLFSGRFEQFSKRIDRLMRIWKKASGQIPEWKLILAGDGCDFKMIKDMAAEMELKNIEFLGFQSDMSELYRRSSILCLTSQTEGWGLCLTEAQANGVIPIAFACTDAVKYILSPSGVNGFLVDCFDEEQYADVLVSLAKADAQYRLKLQKNVVEKAKMYSPTRIANQWKSVFDSLKYR